MQRPDPHKRAAILGAAARLFATRPFHAVTLDAVAAAAKVGKGTLYVYFRGKQQLYAALIADAFRQVVQDLRRQLGDDRRSAIADLDIVIATLLAFARRFPHWFQLLRTGQPLPGVERLAPLRDELHELVAALLQKGVRRGELRDRWPRLTALYVPALVRAVVLYGPRRRSDAAIARHLQQVLTYGLRRAPRRRTNRRTDTASRSRARQRS